MKKRNPAAVFLLPFITLGIYSWYWAVKTKGEMNKMGEKIPTAWIWLIPIVGGIWWYWKYSEGVEHVTKEKLNGVLAFILLFLLGNIGQAIIQTYYNNLGLEPSELTQGNVPSRPTTPTVAATPSSATTQPDAATETTQKPPTTPTNLVQ